MEVFYQSDHFMQFLKGLFLGQKKLSLTEWRTTGKYALRTHLRGCKRHYNLFKLSPVLRIAAENWRKSVIICHFFIVGGELPHYALRS